MGNQNKSMFEKNIAPIIAFCYIIFSFGVFLLVLLGYTKTNDTNINTILNAINGINIFIIGYYFGSSKGSKDKQEQLNEINQ
jgi:uncharacterized membrane protein YbhN (UPF0104 family)